MITEPNVEVWAYTIITRTMLDRLNWDDSGDDTSEIDLLHEAAGRSCYESWSRPNPNTGTTHRYLAHVLEVGHESVLAHGSLTLYLTGISRALTHELVRHRFLGFSQVSQRYVDSKNLDWVCPPRYIGNEDMIQQLDTEFSGAVKLYEEIVRTDLEAAQTRGETVTTQLRKRAREAARAVLPNMTETRIVVTGNLRAWRDFIALRWSEHADQEIDRLAEEIMSILREYAPDSVQDLQRTV